MPFVRSNAVDLCYQTFGDPADPAMLLIMGLGEQLVAWPDGFCVDLAARGFHVVRFDNRDIGLSTWLDELGDVDVPALFAGDRSSVRYGLSDMAADTAGLIEALGLRRAHLAGVSMGGMIAQLVAVERPDLVASLASIMSTTGDRTVGQATLDDVSVLMPRPDADREAAIAADVSLYRLIGSPGVEISEEDRVGVAAAKVDRAYHPAGTARQFAAIVTAADRTPRLRTLQVPTVVIHGEADRLVDVSGGRATAGAVPGAELVLIPGMGHDLPAGAWGRIIDAIATNAARA
ncbi:alpha/beta fold hydrolase [Jidongwangia harbinensis]|uniref:alpha/beta fold hydrolase n=1 Tax=Jidongwangia harbinensis TaxID=2878561 RepID=UPI001CD95973|nr:alpha/beta fold hydrolase [Jidongwangia harbinensis]MCA2211617.1 alpha/beta fold hydrolase [Jidongwangia harbinensis]